LDIALISIALSFVNDMNRNIPEKKKYYKVEAYLDDLPLEWKERFIVVRELILAFCRGTRL